MKSVRYEMLGAPTLLYRHDDKKNSNQKKRHHISTGTTTHQQRFHPETCTPQQIRMKEYLEDNPFREWFQLDGGKKKAQVRRKRRREEIIIGSSTADNTSSSSLADGSSKRSLKRHKSNRNNDDDDGSDEMENENDNSSESSKDMNETKRLALQYYTFDLDNNDVPPEYILEKHANDNNGDELNDNGKEVTEVTTRKNEVGGALGYGNCLVAIKCTCLQCCGDASSMPHPADDSSDSSSDKDDTIATTATTPTSFLVHPVGEKLSSLTIDNLILPRQHHHGDEGEERSSRRSQNSTNTTIDVGGTILQISMCGMGVTSKVRRMNQEEDRQSECLVVRTSRYCVVILARACSNAKDSRLEEEEVHSKNSDGCDKSDDDASLSSKKRDERCSTTFELMELSRIDLCKPTHPSYLPVSVTCDPKVVFSPFANPSFAILSRSNEDQTIHGMDCTTIHKVVQFGHESRISKHTLSSLANISLIEYHASEMSVLWAAARATNVPKPYNKDKNDNNGAALLGGYGHSLFKINLRNDTASHAWSPSKAEYMPEGAHSINGVMNDLRYKHVVWVSSSSACKVWALDIRHNAANVVMCFSLAQLSDDFGPELGVAGFYGAGMVMSQPLPCNECIEGDCSDASEQQWSIHDTPPIMFGLKKDPNTYSLHTYQLPTTMPRFQTMPLEASSFVEAPSVKHSTSCIARSNIYPLPICSEKTFRVGLATLRFSSSNSVLRKVDWKDKMGYDEAPNIIYALTMTSVGDIHCHALLECDSKREVQARRMDGMPVGAAAISVPMPVGKMDDVAVADGSLRITLSNDFPPSFDDVALL